MHIDIQCLFCGVDEEVFNTFKLRIAPKQNHLPELFEDAEKNWEQIGHT